MLTLESHQVPSCVSTYVLSRGTQTYTEYNTCKCSITYSIVLTGK